MSDSVMRRFIEYLTFGKDPDELSQNEINTWVLEGLFEASKNCFETPQAEESQQLISLMCNSFQKLSEEDKLMIIQTFKTTIHEAIYQTVERLENLKKKFIEKVKQT